MTAWLPFVSVLMLTIIASAIAIELAERATNGAKKRRKRVIR